MVVIATDFVMFTKGLGFNWGYSTFFVNLVYCWEVSNGWGSWIFSSLDSSVFLVEEISG